jgi:hypothetical protein
VIREVDSLEWTLTPQSSNVKAWHYDEAAGELLVEYLVKKAGADRSVYRHTPIARAFVDRLLDPGASVGRLLNDLRRDHSIAIERVEVVRAPAEAAS